MGGSSSGGSGSGSGAGSGSGGGGGLNCSAADPDFCRCTLETGSQVNSAPCSTATLQDTGMCCAAPGYPSTGDCDCFSFLCGAGGGGETDCFFQGKGAGLQTTSATGAVCCVWGDSTIAFICSCFDDPTQCDGRGSTVPSCTMAAVPPCSGDITVGYAQVAACR
jgi:hypothetical protein